MMRAAGMIFSLLVLALVAGPGTAADEAVTPPVVDTGSLPLLGSTWQDTNPYRGRPEAVAIGQSAYNQACGRCHGTDANTNAAPAPDLRRLNAYCRRIADAELKAACMADNDAYFAKTVRRGKLIVGVRHMPAWDGILSQELAWAIQVFIESQAAGGPQ